MQLVPPGKNMALSERLSQVYVVSGYHIRRQSAKNPTTASETEFLILFVCYTVHNNSINCTLYGIFVQKSNSPTNRKKFYIYTERTLVRICSPLIYCYVCKHELLRELDRPLIAFYFRQN